MGAGGIGVSALAHMAKQAGAIVSACDRTENDMTRLLRADGVTVMIGHDASHVAGIDLLVHTSAVPPEHPERHAAKEQEQRGKFLARFLDRVPSIGVCGTHGKTTTSWLLADMLIQAGHDPSVFIGGVVPGLPYGNHRIGSGPFVAELDESDGTFLLPHLSLAVITNIESDHLSHYGDDAALFAAFEQFAAGVENGGVLVAGIDSPVAKRVFAAHSGGKMSFAINQPADFRAVEIDSGPIGSSFGVCRRGEDLGRFVLPLHGRHNIQNALAALAAALEFQVTLESARDTLSRARGVDRRMERLGHIGAAVLYSDYAHHPSEVSATLAGLRQRHAGKSLVVFQPHLYTRTRDYSEQFAKALSTADRVLLVDIYPAREAPIPGVTTELIASGLRRLGTDVHGPVTLMEVPEEAEKLGAGCEAIVMMGAGDIDDVARAMARRALQPSRASCR